MPKTNVSIPTPTGYYSGNIFGLIAPAYLALSKVSPIMADEMQKRIATDAESPEDVKRIVKEYITLT